MFTLRQNCYLPQLHKMGEKKKKKPDVLFLVTFSFFLPSLTHLHLSESPSLSLLHALFLFHDPHVLFQQQSITYSTSSSLQSEHKAPRPPVSLTVSFTSWQTPYFLMSPHLHSAFSFSYPPPDWQISIVLEDLHKPLTSHFLAEMAFLTICTVSDHTERPMNAALIPISSTDSARVRKCSQKKKKDGVFMSFFPFLEKAFLTLVLLVKGH